MRPGDFSPGNSASCGAAGMAAQPCFNEAGGFLPRKRALAAAALADQRQASMRPGDFSPGNSRRCPGCRRAPAARCFNEAGGFLPRKPRRRAAASALSGRGRLGFNEAGGFLPRKPGGRERPLSDAGAAASMRPGDFSPGN